MAQAQAPKKRKLQDDTVSSTTPDSMAAGDGSGYGTAADEQSAAIGQDPGHLKREVRSHYVRKDAATMKYSWSAPVVNCTIVR